MIPLRNSMDFEVRAQRFENWFDKYSFTDYNIFNKRTES